MKTLSLTRFYDVPRKRVWEAWTKPELLVHWWGPHGFINPVCEVDLRVGGLLRIHMCDPEGTVFPMAGEFKEVVVPERLVFTSAALDDDDKPLFEVRISATFGEQNQKTKLTVQAEVTKVTPDAELYLQGMEAGWTQSLERLGESLATDKPRLLFMTRIYDVPRESLFKAWASPEQLQEEEFFTGMNTPDGDEFFYKGIFHEIVVPQRIVYSLAVADSEGNLVDPESVGIDPEWPNETVVTVTFTSLPGNKTRISLHQTALESIAKQAGVYDSWSHLFDELV